MPPKELFAPFENRLEFCHNGSNRVFDWKYDGYGGRFFFRLAGRADVVWFARFATATDWFGVAEQERTLFYERALKNLVLEKERFYRLAPVPEAACAPEGSWLLLRPGASGLLLADGWAGANWNVVFPWAKGQEAFLSAPLGELEREIIRAIANAPGEWQHVLAWAQMSREERFWSVVSWKRGDKEEWGELVRALFQLQLRLLPDCRSTGWDLFTLNTPRFAYGPLRMRRDFLTKNFHDATWLLLDCLELHFLARINYAQVRSFTVPFMARNWGGISVKAERPTHHELMQALDLWRDFGRRSNQLPRVEALLRELLS